VQLPACSFRKFSQISSHPVVFFSHNKLVNSTLSRNNLVKRTGVVVKLLDEEFDLVAGRAACFGNRPEHGPTFLFEPTMHLLGRALAGVSMVHEVDVCLSRPDEVCCSGQSWLGSPTPSMAANSPYSLDMGLPVDDDVAAVEGQHASDGAPTAAMTINSFIGTFRKPLSRPILPRRRRGCAAPSYRALWMMTIGSRNGAHT
jgi:hypothetical protein